MLILYGVLKRERDAAAEQQPRIGNHGESTTARLGEDPLNAEPPGSGRHWVLLLSLGRYIGIGAVNSGRGDRHHVPGV